MQILSRLNLVTLLTVFLLSTSAHALLINNCGGAVSDFGTGCSLQELFNGGDITVNDKLFDRWVLSLNAADGANGFQLPDLTLIEVIGLDDQKHNPGLKYNANGQWAADGTETDTGGPDFDILTTFDYFVSVIGGVPLIKDNSLELNMFSFGPNSQGLIRIAEDVCTPADPCIPASPDLGIKEVFAFGNGQQQLFDEIFFLPQSEIHVFKQVLLAADLPGDVFSLDMFTQRFSQVVPEPTTLALMALALAGLGFQRRKAA